MSATGHYDRAPCGLATIDRRGRWIDRNATIETMIGPTTLERAGGFLPLLRAGDRIYWETHIGPLLDMRGEVNEIAVELASDAGPLPVLLNARKARPGDPAGTIELAIFAARDRRSYERELLEARKAAEASEATARELAATLQSSLLPPALPEVPGLELSASYRPASRGAEVGGDFYDVFRTPASWILAIGDVCGKGPAAATATSLVRYTLRGAAMETADAAEMLNAINKTLIQDAKITATLLLACFTQRNSGLDVAIAAAGHPLPRLATPRGRVKSVGTHGALLGSFSEATWTVESQPFEPGELLVAYTDGVTEARRSGDFFGEDGLDRLIADRLGASGSIDADEITDAAVEFQDGHPQDDIAAVVVRHRPSDGSGPP